MDTATQLVKDHWSAVDCSADERNFYCFPPLRARFSSMVFGKEDASPDWCERLTADHFRGRLPFAKCLSICCGFGHLERSLSKLGVARRFVGIDIAPGAIDQARQRAIADGFSNIEYQVGDLNIDPLPNQEYDLIWANGALHHLANLEEVVAKLSSALVRDGYLVCTEYIGPRYQQLNQARQDLVHAARQLLPLELRSRVVVHRPFGTSLLARTARFVARQIDSKLHTEPAWEMLPLEYFLATDPSESVSSDRIVSTLDRFFKTDVRGFGGSILYYALDTAFFRKFDARIESHQTALQALFHFEDSHLSSIGHDNAHIICARASR
jgi:SAM-dependent methyltransferase